MSTDTTNTKKKTGRIYQLVNMITNEKYVGATLQTLYKRQYDSRVNYNLWLNGKSKNSDNHKLFDSIHEYGWECFRIELLTEVEVNHKAELHKIEGDYIRKLDTFNNGLNGQIPQRDKKEYDKQKYEYNKLKISQQHKQYYQNNKDKILKNAKQYQQHNKDKILQYQNNNSNKYNCSICCYSTYNKTYYTRHLNSRKHKFAVMY